MAKHDREEATTEQTEAPDEVSLTIVPVGPVTHGRQAVSLDSAFMGLCEAMAQHLDAQGDVPNMRHAEDIMGWYTNGNTAIAWQHAVLLLEGVIGVPLRG